MSVPLGGLLKHIPCPNGDACTTLRCLFRHAKDEIGLAPPSSAGHLDTPESYHLASSSPPAIHTVQDEDNAQQPVSPRGRATPQRQGLNPRKRPLEAGSGSEKADDALPEPRRESSHQGSHHIEASAASAVLSGAASLPRSLKRPRNRVGKVDDATAKAETPRTPAVASAAPAKPLVESQKASVRDAEVLNPRFLRSAPAKHETRLRLLKMLHKHFKRLNDELRANCTADEMVTLVLSEQHLIFLALDLEESYAMSKSSAVYADAMKHRVMAYMRMKLDEWKKERLEHASQPAKEDVKRDVSVALRESADLDQTEPHKDEPVVAKPPAPQPESDIPAAQEIEILKRRFLTPIDKLAAFGYVPAVPSAADIQAAREAEAVCGGWEVCSECSTRFQVFPGRREEDGALASRGPCLYHPSRYDNYRDAYYCCGESSGADGCTRNENHHFKVGSVKRLAALWNFVGTPANPNVPADRAVCFDCEMAYTVYGMEVVRLTATDWRSGRVLLDVLVRPLGEIIDLNSQYSGVWPKDMADAQPYSVADSSSSADASATEKGTDKGGESSRSSADAKADATSVDGKVNGGNSSGDAKVEQPPLQIVPSPQVARELLFALISPETPLIGHGLENDLNVMRIVHPTLVDTVLLFPHSRGLPYRNSLKSLALRYLGRGIQNRTSSVGGLQGHDSAEDARAAGDLVRYKIRQK